MSDYRLVTEIGTGQLRIFKAGKSDFEYDAGTHQVVYPGNTNKCPYDLIKYIVYWNTSTSQYVLGDEIVYQSQDLSDFLEENAIWEDPLTSISGPPHIMQTLVNRRELFNDTENPLYVSGFSALNPAVTLINTIHGKTGWHQAQVNKALYGSPKDLLFYYGWMNSFNSTQNSWNNELVAQDMARYSMIVLGDGIQDSSHGDYSNTTVIIARIKVINPNTKIFGYVTVNQDLSTFQTKAGQWNTLGIHGIFLDEAGYDHGTTTTNSRSAFNTKVDYVHAQSSANIAFVNAWNMDHIIGTENDASYPNATWNPTTVDSNLTENDWYLLESFGINSLVYTGTNGYEPKATWEARSIKAIARRYTFGINLAGVGVIGNSNSSGQDLFDFGFVSAAMVSLDAWGSSDDYYGSSSASVKWWSRPEVSDLTHLYSLSPSIQVDTGDSDIYFRYIEGAKLVLDFSSSGEFCSILRYAGGDRMVAHVSEESEAQTTSTSYVSRLSLTTPKLLLGARYKTEWFLEVGQENGYNVGYKVDVDGTTEAEGVLVNGTGSKNFHSLCGYFVSTALSDIINVVISYKNTSGSGTAYIRRARILVTRLA